jgi:hypothetical protein
LGKVEKAKRCAARHRVVLTFGRTFKKNANLAMRRFFDPHFEVKKVRFSEACQYREQLPRFPISPIEAAKRSKYKYRKMVLSTVPKTTIYVVLGKLHFWVKLLPLGRWQSISVARTKSRWYAECPHCLSKASMLYIFRGRYHCSHCVPLPSVARLTNRKGVRDMTAALRLGDVGLVKEHLDGTSQQMISAMIALAQEGDSQLLSCDSRTNDSNYSLERLDESDYMVRLRTGERLIYAGGRLQIR